MSATWRRVAAPVLAAALLLTGCGLLDPPVLSGGGDGATTVAGGGTTWFGTHLCLDDGDAEVTIEEVAPRELGGADREELDARVAWAPLLVAERLDNHRGPVPPGYEPAAGATGKVGECSDPDGNAWLIVGLPDSAEPVWLEDLDLSYTVDGDPATARIEASWVQCPIWAKAVPGERDRACQRLNRMGS